MVHGILILWHENFQQLQSLISCFDDRFHLFIHLDRKAKLSTKQLSLLEGNRIVKGIFQKYNVTWGGFNLLKAELFLIKMAISDTDLDYIHVLSAQDYPVRCISRFLMFFESNKGKEFVSFVHMPYEKWDYGTYKRYRYFQPRDLLSRLKGKNYNNFLEKIILFQERIGIKRRIPDQYDYLYGGSNWFSITIECAKYIVSKINGSFYRRLKYTFAPEETFFPTIILNSPYADNVVNSNLRYISWMGANQAHPEVLTLKKWGDIIMNDVYFARKFDVVLSAELKNAIDSILLADEKKMIDKHGAWHGKTLAGHYYDRSLGEEIVRILRVLNVDDIADFGCGPGWYTYLLYKEGFVVNGYDGNPYVKNMTSLLFDNEFYCQYADLSQEISIESPFDMIISLEVGEHIPAQYEDMFFQNIANNVKRYVLLSWAIPGQIGEGHVNSHSNEYVISKMKSLGFLYDEYISRVLRSAASLYWFKNTLMFFIKSKF